MSLEKTLVILKPSAVQRGLIGEITTRFETERPSTGWYENDATDGRTA